MRSNKLFVLPLAGLLATAAQAQEVDLSNSVFDDTYVTVGVGAAYGPSYDGSDDYVISPLPVVLGAVDNFEIAPRPAGVAVDLIRDVNSGQKVEFILGPVVTLNFDRTRQIEDDVVRQLGKLDTAIEVGPTAGIKFNQLLNPYDSLTAVVDAKWDVAGAHDGMIINPSLTYFTPVSLGAAVSLTLSAEHVDDDFADYYYSITPAGSAATGGVLPAYQASGGWKSLGGTLLFAYDLNGDITDGGWGLIVLGGYSRLMEDAKRSPVTSIRGDADQWLVAAGIGYTF